MKGRGSGCHIKGGPTALGQLDNYPGELMVTPSLDCAGEALPPFSLSVRSVL